MNILFYPRLALSGMRRDWRIYAPYLAACVFMTAVVYDLAFLADSPALYAIGSGVNGMGTSAIRLVMTLGKWVMAVLPSSSFSTRTPSSSAAARRSSAS